MNITFTGVDEGTDLAELCRMDNSYCGNYDIIPHDEVSIEWAVLYSPTRCGDDPRYPSIEFIEEFIVQTGFALSIAIHLCGGAVDLWLERDKKLLNLTQHFGNIQLNFNDARKPIDVDLLKQRIADQGFGNYVTLQMNENNKRVINSFGDTFIQNLQFLVDSSGGRGDSPTTWPHAHRTIRTGYAGGLGPENIYANLTSIAAKTHHPLWIDMESNIRTDNQFDLNKCKEVLNECSRWATDMEAILRRAIVW